MSSPNDPLYTARYHLVKGKPVPDGAPRNALLALLEPILGPMPVETPPTAKVPVKADELPEMPTADHPTWRHPIGNKLPIIGVPMANGRLPAYLQGLPPEFNENWKPTAICIHHTAAPSLKQRPEGFKPEHMDNLRDYYLSRGWSSGPHWFVDDHACWAFSPMSAKGTHAVAFNKTAIGIEMLGDYDTEDPKTGRGALVIARTVDLVRQLMAKYGLTADDIVFHREDHQTTKTCPGHKIIKSWFLAQVTQTARQG